ncbi:MAG: transcriptional repressor [Bacteroidota bacterium]
MEEKIEELTNKLAVKGLKVTPQRVSILNAVYNLNNHPTAENIIAEIRQKHPHIATGTVYKVLETLVENEIIKKVKTEKDIMRYDGVYESHHHLYCSTCDLIEDYNDAELDQLLRDYFKTKELAGFKIEEFVLQIKGKFDKC